MTLLTPGLETQSGVELLANVYHTMAQPLTELHGTLELALLRDPHPDAARDALKQSLAAAKRAMASLDFFRDLVDATLPGDVAPLDLSRAIREIFEEFRPIAEDEQITFEALGGPELWIRGNLNRLTQALTLVMDCMLAASPRSIRLEPVARGYQLRVTGAHSDAFAGSRPVEVARVLLIAMHCNLLISDSAVAITADALADPDASSDPAPQKRSADSNDLVSQ